MTLLVRRARFSIEEPWSLPPDCERVAMRKSTDGTIPHLPTTVALYADDSCLNVLFHAIDDGIVATYLGHDEPLYEEDVVEVFLAPGNPTRYYEIEANPLGTTFDARVESPDGVRATMRIDLRWECEGLFVAIRKVPGLIETLIRIPFASLGVPRPAAGDEWLGNFFRIDRNPSNRDEYSAWRPTLKNPADFHVVAAFGRMGFE